MKPSLIWVLAGLLLANSLAQAQVSQTEDDDDAQESRKEFSFTITPRMIEGMLGKMADGTSDRYGFDEDQKYQTRELFRDRLSNWMADNQDRIQPLMSNYFEEFLSDTPPSPEMVAEWAEQIRPLAQDFKEVVINMSDDMGDYMTEDQLIQKEGEIAAIDTMFTFLDQRLENWENGGWDAVTEHPTGAQFHEAERERHKALMVATDEAREQVIQEIYNGEGPFGDNVKRIRSAASESNRDSDPWAKYVREFIAKYGLTAEQTNQCERILRKYQDSRDNYLRRVDPELLQIEIEMTKTPKGPVRDKLVARYEDLAKPIETKFTVLKEKLNKIPTRAQRTRVRDLEQASSATTPARQ